MSRKPLDYKTLKRICTEYRRGILGKRSSKGMCAAVSWALQGYLSFQGLETRVVEGDVGTIDQVVFDVNHLWLELADGMVIDPTADQFNTEQRKFPKVYIGEPIPGIHIKNRECLVRGD